jgi:hypothetical protein
LQENPAVIGLPTESAIPWFPAGCVDDRAARKILVLDLSQGLVGVVVQEKRKSPAIGAKSAWGIKWNKRIREHSFMNFI